MQYFFTVSLLISLSGMMSLSYGQWLKHTIDPNLPYAAIVYAGDIDGDSDLDVAATGYGAGGGVFWYENNLPAGWNKYPIDATFLGAVGVFVADIDGDDTLDVVAVAGGSTDDVVWFENRGGTPISWTTRIIDSNLNGAEVVYVADIDGDNDLDVAATAVSANDVVWYENEGGTPPTWNKHTIDANLLSAITCHVADIDGDDTLDVVATGSVADDVVWYENEGGTPITWSKYTIDANLDGAWWVDAVDIDGDGDVDVFATGQDANDVVWYENAGGTPISWNKYTIDSNLGGAFVVDFADFDLDTDLDLVATGIDADMVVWYQNEGGVPINWSPPQIIDANLGGANTVFAADIDGNDTLDVFATGTNATVVVWYENKYLSGIELLSGTVPTGYVLTQNYPNPFNPSTAIEFSIPKSEFVTLKIYNTLGEEVATLVSDRLSVGSYQYEWDATRLASGIYLYRLQAGDYAETRKMMLIK
jgi:hypothetical protein